MIDVNVYQENIFHTKMVVKQFCLDEYLFCVEAKDLSPQENQRIQKLLRRKLKEIFYGRNLDRNLEFMS